MRPSIALVLDCFKTYNDIKNSLRLFSFNLASSREDYVMESFMKYCEETSLHGWKYVQASSTLERFSWLALLILALSTASFLVFKAVNDFLAHTVSTNMDSLSTTYDNLYFPAITVCNMNFMQRSVLEKYNIQHNDTLITIFDRLFHFFLLAYFSDFNQSNSVKIPSKCSQNAVLECL